MTNHQSIPGAVRLIITGAALVIVVAGMKNVAPLINVILLSIVFALACSPLLHWLRRKGAPDWMAVLVTVSIFLVVLLLFGAKRLPEIGSALGKGIREFKGSVREIETELKAPLDDVKSMPPKAPTSEKESDEGPRRLTVQIGARRHHPLFVHCEQRARHPPA